MGGLRSALKDCRMLLKKQSRVQSMEGLRGGERSHTRMLLKKQSLSF